MSKEIILPTSDIKKAILGCKGMISVVAKRLKVDWHTADKLIKDHKLEIFLKDEKEILLDFAESKLFENINANETTSIIFYLKTQGKCRGYIDKSEVEHSGEIKTNDVSQLSTDELIARANATKKISE